MASRSEIRRQRYRYYIDVLGLTAPEARRLRDVAPSTAEPIIQAEIRRIQNRPQRRRTAAEIRKLERYQAAQFQSAPRERSTDDPTERLNQYTRRLDNFRRWSKKNVGFPPSLLRQIRAINIDAGRDPNAGYGFRVFYHRYVKDESPIDAQLKAERRDT